MGSCGAPRRWPTAMLVPASEDGVDGRPAVAVGQRLVDLVAEPDRPALEEVLVPGPARRSGDELDRSPAISPCA